MCTRRDGLWLVFVSALVVGPSATAEEATVRLPLSDYVALTEQVAAAEREAEQLRENAEPGVREITERDLAIWVEGRRATVETSLRIVVRGQALEPIDLPVPGWPAGATIEVDGAPVQTSALDRAADGRLRLVATEPGLYDVRITSHVDLEASQGSIPLRGIAAGVSTATLDLPPETAWTCPGAVAVEDGDADGRRRVRLALARDRDLHLQIERALDRVQADSLLARASVVTVVGLEPDGVRRRDIVAFDVLRGALGDLEVRLPEGVRVDEIFTDEGPATPTYDGTTLRVRRTAPLVGGGHMILGWRLPVVEGALPLAGIAPAVPTADRFLVVASSVAASFAPEPAAAWTRVDLSDLPAYVRSEIHDLRASAAWQALDAASADARLVVDSRAPMALRGAVVTRRESTTLLTGQGTRIHKDRFEILHAGTTFTVSLPPAAELWSAQVGDDLVRPVRRGDALIVPLPYRADGGPVAVEIIATEEGPPVPKRGSLAMALAVVDLPVYQHAWHLLLPEGRQYRWSGGMPTAGVPIPRRHRRFGFGRAKVAAPEPIASARGGIRGTVTDLEGNLLPGVTVSVVDRDGVLRGVGVTDHGGDFALHAGTGRYEVRAELEGFSSQSIVVDLSDGRWATVTMTLSSSIEEMITVTSEYVMLDAGPSRSELAEKEARRDFGSARDSLASGLVSGIKPLQIRLPESGKAIALSTALPPTAVHVVLDVRPGRRR